MMMLPCRHRVLFWQLLKREVVGRYRGSMLGLLWSFFNPLIMLAVYTFVFSVVFRARWGQESAGDLDFALLLFAGMIVHGFFAECISRAPTLILNNAVYVKKVIFPLDVLPWVTTGSALLHAVIGVAVLLAAVFLFQGRISWSAAYWPIIMLPLFVLTLGVCFVLASLGVYLRDVAQVTGFLSTVLLFFSPVFYPMSALPEAWRVLFLLNPLTFVIEQCRMVLLFGQAPDWAGLGLYGLIAGVIGWLGFVWFHKTRRGFVDVL
jgi:lipopolysaccharide transport system permease protein